ncbi:MAG: hypothetical protein B9S32_03790 [Verrucomicrobia bacterium Tous-C9LFEB]|nr:MAG: hypothetical protein B9S32_03790 [Verrucomicrobia bacterium Tous-C9LFEB]
MKLHPFSLLAFLISCSFLLPLGAADPVPLKNDRMGVVTHFCQKTRWMDNWDAERHIPMIADLGVGWIRENITPEEIEPERGVYRIPEKTWKWINLAQAHGLKIIVCFNGATSRYPDGYDPQVYAKAAAWLAVQLKDKVQVMEIVNEPFNWYADYYRQGKAKSPGSWYGRQSDGSLEPWMARYVTLLNTTADAIKKANPSMTVIGIGSVMPQNYLMLEMGISKSVDGLTDHPYSFRSTPEITPHAGNPEYIKKVGFAVADADGSFASYVRRCREQMSKCNGPQQIWFTEFGYTTYREGHKSKKFMYSAVTEEAQAKYSLRRFMECLGLGVEVTVQYDFLEDELRGGEFEAESRFGLVRNDGSLKPAYHAVRNLARSTADLRPGSSVKARVVPFSDRTEEHPRKWDGGPLPALSRIMLYPFTNSHNEAVFAVWSAERPGDLNVRSADLEFAAPFNGTRVEVTDLMTGQTRVVKVDDMGGALALRQFPVPDYPVLLRFIPSEPSKNQ